MKAKYLTNSVALPELPDDVKDRYFGDDAVVKYHETYRVLKSQGEILLGGFDELHEITKMSADEDGADGLDDSGSSAPRHAPANPLTYAMDVMVEEGVITPREGGLSSRHTPVNSQKTKLSLHEFRDTLLNVPSIKLMTIHSVGSHSSANSIASFEDGNGSVGGRSRSGGGVNLHRMANGIQPDIRKTVSFSSEHVPQKGLQPTQGLATSSSPNKQVAPQVAPMIKQSSQASLSNMFDGMIKIDDDPTPATRGAMSRQNSSKPIMIARSASRDPADLKAIKERVERQREADRLKEIEKEKEIEREKEKKRLQELEWAKEENAKALVEVARIDAELRKKIRKMRKLLDGDDVVIEHGDGSYAEGGGEGQKAGDTGLGAKGVIIEEDDDDDDDDDLDEIVKLITVSTPTHGKGKGNQKDTKGHSAGHGSGQGSHGHHPVAKNPTKSDVANTTAVPGKNKASAGITPTASTSSSAPFSPVVTSANNSFSIPPQLTLPNINTSGSFSSTNTAVDATTTGILLSPTAAAISTSKKLTKYQQQQIEAEAKRDREAAAKKAEEDRRNAMFNTHTKEATDAHHDDGELPYGPLSPRAIFLSGCLRSKLPPRVNAVLRKKLSTTINLAHMGIGNDTAKVLAEAIHLIPHLQVINLCDNALEDDGLSALIRSIAKHPSIEILDISQNTIDENAADALADFIGRDDCYLKCLRMSNANIDDGECASFVEVLMHNRHLKVRQSFHDIDQLVE